MHVVAVATASAALKALAATAAAFDLIVTDFNMPGSSGLDLASEVARLYPGLPVVITSGYVSDELSRSAGALGIRQILQKQNLFEELVPVTLRILSERDASASASRRSAAAP